MDGRETVALALNQASFIARKPYKGFSAFRSRCLELLPQILGALRVTNLARVVFRYENELGVQREDGGVLPLGKLLNVHPACDTTPPEFTSFQLESIRKWAHGRLHTNVWVDSRPETGDTLRFNIAAEVVPAGDVKDLERLATTAHDEARAYFERLITDDFRTWLKGDVTTGVPDGSV